MTPSGATLKDTMVRAGQSSEKTALIYQHSDEERQRDVAANWTTWSAPSVRSAMTTTARSDDRMHPAEKYTGN